MIDLVLVIDRSLHDSNVVLRQSDEELVGWREREKFRDARMNFVGRGIVCAER